MVADIPDFSTDSASARRIMVDSQLRTNDVNDPAVLAALTRVPREIFVPATRKSTAYMDRAVPLANGRMLDPPLAAGLLLSRATITRADTVLVVAAGSGYLAAAASLLAHHIVALEEDAQLAAMAQSALAGYAVEYVIAPLAGGHSEAAPYDVILINGAVAELPPALIAQLADGGRLVTGLLQNSVTRLAIGRKNNDHFGLTVLADSDFTPLPQFAAARTYIFQ